MKPVGETYISLSPLRSLNSAEEMPGRWRNASGRIPGKCWMLSKSLLHTTDVGDTSNFWWEQTTHLFIWH